MKRFVSYLGAALAVLLFMVGGMPASAATPASSTGLSIIPRINLVVNPGQSTTSKLVIGNLSQTADLDLTLKLIDFTFTNDTGTPKLFLSNSAPQTTWSLKPFVSMPQSVVVPRGQTKTVTFSVKVPKNQGAGSYYSAIDYQSGTGNGGNVTLNASGVSLVFLSVPGIVHEDMNLQKFGTYQTDTDGVTGRFTYVNTNMPEWIGTLLQNNGNVAESPAGSITIHDMWGHKLTTISNFNPNQSLAILGQTRLFLSCIKNAPTNVQLDNSITKSETCTNPHLKPGFYTLNFDAFYGQNGNQTKEITGTAHFWYLPWWVIVVLIILVLLIVGFIFWVRRKIRKAKNRSKTPNFKAGRK